MTSLIDKFSAHNYHPLPVTIAKGDGNWVWDTDGKKYLDLLAGYSAVNFGHANPQLMNVAIEQIKRVTLTSRAFNNDQLGPFCSRLAKLCRKDKVLPMNTGAEGVESAIKLARRWGYMKKGVPQDKAEIIVCERNFHGRTITVVSFSSDQCARDGFGPFTPGFISVPFGDAAALESAITENTVAFLMEPVQGEAGVIPPPPKYLEKARWVCTKNNILMIADEIQSGLGRVGRTLACDLGGVEPDVYILGKALGGGIMPLSAVVTNDDTMEVFTPGSHGSTFGGNPLACAIGSEVIDMLNGGTYQLNAELMGQKMLDGLHNLNSPVISEIRSVGLWFGIDIDGPNSARYYGERLMEAGVLTKETHDKTLRFSPALCINEDTIYWLMDVLRETLV